MYDKEDEDTEGYFLTAEKYNWGGWTWMIVENLSNGYGEYVIDEANDFSGESVEVLQAAIKEYGAIIIDVNDSKTNSFRKIDGYKTQLYTEDEEFDHAATIVGWDDSFPKEYFSKEASRDGAWLVQNTKGDSWGNDGFFWLSYDSTIRSPYSLSLSTEFEKVISYGVGNENKVSTGEVTTTANKFHEAGKLKAVGTFTPVDNEKVVVEIYDEEMNNLLATKEMIIEQNGYHVIDLDEPIDVTDFTIVINYYGDAPVEGETVEFDEFVSFKAGINPGESYIKIDGEWFDLSDAQVKKSLAIDFEPNNACIKALY